MSHSKAPVSYLDSSNRPMSPVKQTANSSIEKERFSEISNFENNHATTTKGHHSEMTTSFGYEHPSFQNDQPSFQNDQPSFQNGQQSFQNDQQSFQNDQPSFQHDQASFHNDQPSFQHDQPSFQNDQPSFQNDQPSFQNDQPSFQNDQQSFHNDQQSFHNDQPSFQNDQPSFQNDQPSFQNVQQSFQNDQPSFHGDTTAMETNGGSVKAEDSDLWKVGATSNVEETLDKEDHSADEMGIMLSEELGNFSTELRDEVMMKPSLQQQEDQDESIVTKAQLLLRDAVEYRQKLAAIKDQYCARLDQVSSSLSSRSQN